MRHLIDEAGLSERVRVDSAGTGNWHIGEAPDERAQRAGSQRGYDLASLRARQIEDGDFSRFDWIVAMDDANVTALRAVCPPSGREKIRLLMEFAPATQNVISARVVVDPYFGGEAGFEMVLDQCETACAGLLAALRTQLAV